MTMLNPVEIPESGVTLPDAVDLEAGSSYEIPNDGQVWVYLEFTGRPAVTLSSEIRNNILALGSTPNFASPFVLGPFDPYVYGRLLRLNIMTGPVSARVIRLRPLVVSPGQLSERYRGPIGPMGLAQYTDPIVESLEDVGGDLPSLTNIIVPEDKTFAHISLQSDGIYGHFGSVVPIAYSGYYPAVAIDLALWRAIPTSRHAQRLLIPEQAIPFLHPQTGTLDLGIVRGEGDVLGVIWDNDNNTVNRIQVRYS